MNDFRKLIIEIVIKNTSPQGPSAGFLKVNYCDLEFSPESSQVDVFDFVGLSCTHREVISLCCLRHSGETVSAVNECEKFLLPHHH